MVRDLLHAMVVGAFVVTAGFALAPLSARVAVILVAVAIGIVGAVVAIQRRSRTASRVAFLIERRDPSLKNLVVTAEELLRHPDRSADWIVRRVFDNAASRLGAADLGLTVPIAGAALAAFAAVLVAAVTPAAVGSRGIGSRSSSPQPARADAGGPRFIEAARSARVFEAACLGADRPAADRCSRRHQADIDCAARFSGCARALWRAAAVTEQTFGRNPLRNGLARERLSRRRIRKRCRP